MKRIALLAATVFLTLGLPACVKIGSTAVVNNDATGTFSLKIAVKTEAIEQMKAMVESMTGGVEVEGAESIDEAFSKMDEMLDDKQMAEKLRESGLKVTSSKVTDKEGWKGVDIEAEIPDINAWVAKAAKQTEKDLDGTPLAGMNLGATGAGLSPHFYKTETQGVGQVMLVPPLGDIFGAMGENPLDQLDELSDEELDMVEAQMDMFKQMFALDQMSMEMSLQLPGNILSTKGCRKTGDKTVTFSLKGSDLTLDGVKGLFGLKDGISATFTIPEDCKIVFVDPPKPSQETKTPAPVEEKEKKGGLKIGEEKKGQD